MMRKMLLFGSAIVLTIACLVGPAKPAAACPASFCMAAQQAACRQTCHNHGLGLLCDFSTCTSGCYCGSVPPG